MIKPVNQSIVTDVLVIGSGLAGLLVALELADRDATVLLLSKDALSDSNTSRAQGGMAAVVNTDSLDSIQSHLNDTLMSGAGLTDESIARLVLSSGESLVRRLMALGVTFDRTESGHLQMALEGGHSRPRVLHNRDTTGKSLCSALIERVRTDSRIRVLEDAFAFDLAINDGRVSGVEVSTSGERTTIVAHAVILASGGIGQVFERTTNPSVATGDGIAMAYRAGARLCDMEFVQFHPTAFFKPGFPAFLISEAVRGEGATLLNQAGERFALRFHPDGELATRDVVAQAIHREMQEQSSQYVWLDLRPIGENKLRYHFPNIIATCRGYGIDPLSEPIPVAPAAHYFMGGIWTDSHGQTSIPGLYAIGECASVGLHGANRLASNSLLEAGVMARRAASHIELTSAFTTTTVGRLPKGKRPIPDDLSQLKRQMYSRAGLERDAANLGILQHHLETLSRSRIPQTRAEQEAANILTIARLIVSACLLRPESRGAHTRLDYPFRDDAHLLRRLYMSTTEQGWLEMPMAAAPATQLAPAFGNRI